MKAVPAFIMGLYLIMTPAAVKGQSPPLPQAASAATQIANQAVLKELDFSNTEDFKDASRGLIEAVPDLIVKGANDRMVWNLKQYGFLKGVAPETVNPSLWRNALLNMNAGLFKVTDRIYQLRGFDLSNMSVIETDNGIIVIDPLITAEVAKEALDLYYRHRQIGRASCRERV